MVNYDEARVKLSNTQLSKLKNAAKNKTGISLIITKKNIQDAESSPSLFLTKWQKTKTKNAYDNNLLTMKLNIL